MHSRAMVCFETLEVKLDQSQGWEGFGDEKESFKPGLFPVT